MAKLLIIEDDMDTSALLSRFLKKNGYEVAIANTGNKGINFLTSESLMW